jgi:F-type H+-transporting ATPase subunit delta
MIGSTVAKRYATALYELAHEGNVVPRIAKDLSDLAVTWDNSEDLRRVFESPQFALDAKKALVKAIADKSAVHPLLRNTLMMLSDRRRLKFLPDIAEAFARIAERRAGRVRAEIITASKLPEAYYQQLQKTLAQATGKDVVLVRREDPSLIGGVVTRVGGRVFDGSIKNRLRELRSQLLASTEPNAAAD